MNVHSPSPKRRAVVFDRDGVLVDLVWNPRTSSFEAPLDAASVALRAGAAAMVRGVSELDVLVLVASNQPGYAKGECTRQSLDEVHARVDALLRASGARVDGWYYCYHHPAGVVPEWTGACACRKPLPGLLLEAAREHDLDLASCWMVGDRDSDMEAGRRAGCRTLLVPHPNSGADRSSGPCDARASDPTEALSLLRTLLASTTDASTTSQAS